MSDQPYSDDVLEHAAKTLYEGPDQYGRPSSVTWTEMLTYGGEFPENTTHPIAENFRTMARGVLDAAHDREVLGLDASVCARTHLLEVVSALRQQLSANALHDDTGDPRDEGYSEAQAEMHSWLDVLEREAKS